MEGGSQLYRQGWQSSQQSREQNLRYSRKAAAGSRYKAGNKHKTHCSSFSAQDIFEIFSNLKKFHVSVISAAGRGATAPPCPCPGQTLSLQFQQESPGTFTKHQAGIFANSTKVSPTVHPQLHSRLPQHCTRARPALGNGKEKKKRID